MCPTSNLHTKAAKDYQSHPFLNYFAQGLPVTLNTDNRTVSHISLTDEFEHMLQAGLTPEAFKTLYMTAVSSIFDDDAQKDRLRLLWPE